MTSSPDFSDRHFTQKLPLIEQCRQQLLNSELPLGVRVQLLCRLGWLLTKRQEYGEAIAAFDEALTLQPDSAIAYHYRALLLEETGKFREAIAHYDRAIEYSSAPDAELWTHRANLLRNMGRYREALKNFEKALSIQPDYLQALSGKGGLLAVLGKQQAALKVCQQVLDRYPEAAEAWHSMGIVHSVAGRNKEALSHFEQALRLQPNFDRALCNRGMILTRLDRHEEAIASLDAALSQHPHSLESWCINAWAYRGFALMRLGRYEEAVESCDRALAQKPNCYPAALYKIVNLVLAGQLLRYVAQANRRFELLQNFWTILNFLKYRLLILFGVIFLLNFGQGAWMDVVRRILPIVCSIGVIVLILADLWKHRSRLSMAWKTYFQNHPLTYVRAIATVFATLVTYSIADSIAPPFLRWGWANLVFGQPGNIIFQPFNLFKDAASSSVAPSAPALASQVSSAGAIASTVQTSPEVLSSSAFHLNYFVVLTLLFWAILLLGIPFWARLEERIFRRGANTWRQIAIRSTQFGLVHLLAGIPILGGFVLILPGFLFACRYKYVHDRYLKRTGDPIQAQEAGVDASTADHAVYNAILITLAVGVLLLFQ